MHRLCLVWYASVARSIYAYAALSLFNKISKGKQAKRILLDLFFNAAIINKTINELMIAINPQVTNKIKIIESYPLNSRKYSFVRTDLPKWESLRNNYLKVTNTVRRKQMLALYQQEVMAFCNVHELDAFDALAAEYHQFSRKNELRRLC